jgi:AT hook motif
VMNVKKSSGLGMGQESVGSFPPIKRKRGRPAKNDQARIQA